MLNMALYKREMKGSIKLLVIFGAVITMYVSIIIGMYDPELMKTLDGFVEAMPEFMASVGMKAHAATLLGFMVSYLYGFILLIFPMLFCILRGNALIAKYVDKGSMALLTAAPVKRRTIAFTQMKVLISGIVLLILYSTGLELVCAGSGFPGELDVTALLMLNGGLLCLHLFIGSICFLSSCLFSDTKYSVAAGAGIPIFMYVLQMLANVGGDAEKAKYFTFFTLFNPDGILAGEGQAAAGIFILLAGAAVLYALGIMIFDRKDLHL
ncbi:MAG: ABC transporter permease [Lachnospiraceae bacterium]|jgi:ABC-2 type transport system permease protein|nr:ABC transporter permease [Lachnospiraceae bacterium]